jgi:hypothetical protein
MSDENKDKPDALRAALAKAAESDDAEEKARATRALKAWDEKEKEESKASAPASAADDKDPPADKVKEESKASIAALSAQLASQAQAFESFRKAEAAKEEARELAAFLATWPDLSAETLKALAGDSLAAVKKTVALIPVNPGFKSQVAELERQASVGIKGAGDRSDPETLKALDEKFGLTSTKLGVGFNSATQIQTFGMSQPIKVGE